MKKNIILLLLMIAHATVCAAALKPYAPTGLKIAGGDPTCRIFTWELPDSYTDGTPFPEGVEVSQVKIFRNLTKITVLDGPATQFTDHVLSHEYPVGFDYTLLVYEVSVKVGDEWSEPCIPLQYKFGTQIDYEPIPWEPSCKEFADRDVRYYWTCDSKIWENTAEGMNYMADESVENRNLASSLPLFFKQRHDYVLEYQISSSDNTEYNIAICDKLDKEFCQELVNDAIATDDNTVKKVEFTYQIKVYEGGDLNLYPTIVLRPRHGKNLLLSSMRIYESETTTAPDVFNDNDIRDVRFYDLQGRSAGADPDGFTPGIYIRRQTDSHGNVRCDKLLVR